MSDVGRYRKLYSRLWRHPGFAALSEGEKVLALYLLSGPQSNRLGLYVLSLATAAEDLGTSPTAIRKRLANVCEAFTWRFDAVARVFYIPSFFKWNPPENVNVLKGILRDLNEIPPCDLVETFAGNIETLPATLRETFLELLGQRLPKRSPIQDQGTGNREQEVSAETSSAPTSPAFLTFPTIGTPDAWALSQAQVGRVGAAVSRARCAGGV